MGVLVAVQEADASLTRQAAGRIPKGVGRALSAVEEAAESSKLWLAAAVVLAVAGGRRGRRAALAGVGALALAQLLSNGVGKQLIERPRPPKEWIPHDEVEDRPASSSFPSGHTAAAFAFTAGVASSWPAVGALAAAPAVAVAVERVQSGAHYPSDVAAGALIGVASAGIVRWTPRLASRATR